MFEYFPASVATYWLNYSMCNASVMGATIGDIADAVAPYGAYFKDNAKVLDPSKAPKADPNATASAEVPKQMAEVIYRGKEIWGSGWLAVADRLERQARQDIAHERLISAGDKLRRSAALLTTAEWNMPAGTVRLDTFNRIRANLREGLALSGTAAEYMEIPYEGTTLDGMFLRGYGNSGGPGPTVLFFNGWHASMDWYVLNGSVEALRRRGISCLLFDHPGSGSARFHKNLPMTAKTEISAKAALDYLATRSDVDINAVAAIGCSFGGYYVTRASIFEKRIKGCFVWGAFFCYPPEEIFKNGDPNGEIISSVEMADLEDLYWVSGTSNKKDLFQFVQSVTLEGIIKDLTAALFIFQGKNDVQCPMIHATKTYDGAVNAASRELVVIDADFGGDQHVHMDNLPSALNLMCDKIAELIGGTTVPRIG